MWAGGCSAASIWRWRCSSPCRDSCCGADTPQRREICGHTREPGPYLRSRVARIMPAYVVAVVVILSLLPDADHASLTVLE
ncbi:acyltransferase [Mycobacterium tuberculosis T85]|nr:acyltransferase [Mycobacterium tuberculosis T85]